MVRCADGYLLVALQWPWIHFVSKGYQLQASIRRIDDMQVLNLLPDPWVQAMNPPLEKILLLQRVSNINLLV